MIKGFLISRLPFIFALLFRHIRMTRLLYFSCLMCMLLSCSKGYRIKGTSNLTGLDGKTVSLMTAVDSQWELIDSCELLHGVFRMKGRIDSTMIATLFLDGQAVMPLILEPGKIDVVISDFMLNVSGAPLNDSLYAFIAEKYKLDLRAVELERIEPQMIMNGHAPEEIEAYVDSMYTRLGNDMRNLVLGFIRKNYDNVLSLCGFSMLCNGLPRPMITPLMQEVIDDAPRNFLSHPSISGFLRKAHEATEGYGVADAAAE